MSVTNDWGQGAVNNTIDWGKGKTTATNNWGEIYDSSLSGETNITGSGGAVPFTNTKSILLDGVDDLVTMGDVLNMANDGTDAFTYSLWYKTTDTGSFQMFIGKQRAAVWFNGVTFSMRGNLKSFNIFLGTGQSNQRIKGKTGTISTINDGNWHHVCLTYDGSQVLSGMTLYYDNTPQTLSVDGTQGTPTDVSTAGQGDFMIGARGTASSASLPFNGTLDEVSYFTSELSASDVNAIYGTGVPNDISSLNPVGWWRCGDGDTSPTLTDNGSGGNNGTMTNFTAFSTDVPT